MVLLTVPATWAAGALPVPATGVYLGIWANPALAPTQEAAIEIREGPAPNGINRRFAFHLHYYGWTVLSQQLDGAGVFHPDEQLTGDLSRGRVPVISWTCDDKIANSDHVIAGGDATEDAVITATAKALAQYPGPVLLRWFWEFNVLANNQSCRGDSGQAPTQQVYSDFSGAWQHIWRLFQNAGATNVLFLWNPGNYTADGDANDPHGFYPGNNYVDWIGIDTYQRSTTATFDDDFGLFYSDFSKSQYVNKPLMVGENGSQAFVQHNSEVQGTYFRGILSDVEANHYPQLKAYCYFDAGGTAGSWVLDDNGAQGNGGLAAFAVLATSQSFSPTPNPVVTAAQSADPVWVPGSSQKVCQLIGETDRETMQPTVSRTETNYGLVGNDLGSSFEHNGKLWFLFGDTFPTATFNGKPNLNGELPRVASNNDSVGFTSGTNIEQCVKLDFVRNSIGAYQNPVVLNAQGKSAITLGFNEVPIAGIDVGGRMFVVFGTDNYVAMPVPGNSGFGTRSVLAVSDDDGNTYHYLYDFSAPACFRCEGAKFVNVAIANGMDGYLYFWGSQGGMGYRNSSVFLARKLATGIAQTGSMQYFTGLAMNGTPNFSALEADAAALFQDYTGANNTPSNCTGELGVEYNQIVQRWVMLYNCLDKTPANLSGVYMRFAQQPWGPWSSPQTIFNGQRDQGFCYFIHRAVTATSPACDQVGDPGRDDVGGGGYGPYFLSRFTTGSAASGTSTFYYTMSTWNPYVQVIMKTTVQALNAATVNAASFDSSALSPGAIASLFGAGLSDSIAATSSTDLPSSLAGVSVTIQDSAGTAGTAPLFFVSPGQINFLVPPGLANGAATVTVVKDSSAVAASSIRLATVAPALFSANSSGKGVAAAYFATAANPTIFAFACGSTAGSCVSVPFDLSAASGGAVLVLYGTGIRNNSGLGSVKITIGGIASTAVYASAQNQYPGLDQINVPVPASLAGKGEVDVVVVVNGTAANTVRVAFK